MEYNEFTEKYSPYLRQYLVPLILGFLGLIFLGYGLIGYFGNARDKQDILFEAASTSVFVSVSNPMPSGAGQSAAEEKLIVVDIEGAVEQPGVYRLISGSRMQDALIAAGGLSGHADREFVSKSVNLAAKLVDGMKIYIPVEGEELPQSLLSGEGVLGDVNRLVNINSASIQELDGLPGIGEVTADKIISNRPYETIEVLVEKKVVGQKVFEQIKERIVAQ